MRPAPGEVELYLGVGVVVMDHADQSVQVWHGLLTHHGLIIGGQGAVVLQYDHIPGLATDLGSCNLSISSKIVDDNLIVSHLRLCMILP